MQKLMLAGVALSLAATPSLVAAGAWVGVHLGEAEVDVSIRDFNDGSLSAPKDSTRDTSLRLGGGYDFNRYVGIEAGYMDGGDIALSAISDGTGAVWTAGNVRISTTMTGLFLGLNGYLPVSERTRLTARAGLLAWDVDGHVVNPPTTVATTDDGNDPYIGIGAELDLDESATLNFNFASYDEVEIDSVELGIKLRFGK